MTANLTTVNIEKGHQKELRKLSQSWGMSQIEFLNNAIWYFKKTGINPKSPIFSPKEEISKLEARLNQVIKFIRLQEKEKLNPLLDELIITERRLKESLALGINKSDFEKIEEGLGQITIRINAIYKNQEKYAAFITRESASRISKTENKIDELAYNTQLMIKLLSLLFEALKNRNIAGKLSQNDIENFENALHQIR